MRLDKCEYPSRKSSSEPLHITVNIDNLNAGYLLSKGKKGKKKGGGGRHWANFGLTENYMGIGRDKHC